MSDAVQVALLRKRLMRMIAIVSVCALVAAGAIVGYLSFHIAWMGVLFAVATIAGFGAQIWLVIDFAKAGATRK